MKRSMVAAASLLVALAAFSACSRAPALEDDSALFKDYKKLEETLTLAPRFPNREFDGLYAEFLAKYGWSFDPGTLKDGVYEAYSLIDVRDYVHYIRLEAKGGRIVDVRYDEFKPVDGKGKRDDAAYGRAMTLVTRKITPAETYPLLERSLLESQDPLKVDTVSGATLSSYRFQITALKALYEYRAGRVLNKVRYAWKTEKKEGNALMDDTDMIMKAVSDYVEGWYEADGERMARALHPKLAKRGMSPEGEIWDVNRDWMVEATGRGQGRIDEPGTGKKEITILARTPTIASVKLVSNQFDDYLHLQKAGGEWRIINALWDYR
jgi:major membrane immunogen (membrane-anchored lipoprotein)